MLMSKEELDFNLKNLKIGDSVIIIRKSSTKKECCDYMEGTVNSITEKTLIISFETLSNKRVIKSSIVSLKIR